MAASHTVRRIVLPLAVAAVALGSLGAGRAHAAVPGQAAPGKRVATFIRSEWWPQAKVEVGFPVPDLKKVVCPKSVPATTGDPETVVRAALVDLAAGRVVPSIDPSTSAFGCVGLLDGQRLLIAGALDEAGDARFATASLILEPELLAGAVADAFTGQIGGTADVVCSTRSLIVAQPDAGVRCKVVADDGTKGIGEVVLDGNAEIVSVEFTQK